MLIHVRIAAACAALTALLAAQGLTGVPQEFLLRIPPGGWVDLDTGMILPAQKAGRAVADLRFDRDGLGFYAWFPQGGETAGGSAEAPDGAWSDERFRMSRRDTHQRQWFARTDQGHIARVTLAVADPYSTASAAMRWVVVPSGMARFLPPPRGLTPSWSEGEVLVRWAGEQDKYLVQIEEGEATRKVTVDTAEVRVALADDGPPAKDDPPAKDRRVTLTVWGMGDAGLLTLPAKIVCAGRAMPARRGVVEFGNRWYDASGGLSLQAAAIDGEDAAIVFYLYGIYVPGGGILRTGRGEADYLRLQELPATGYVPSHDRLDEGDVFAVQLADGTAAKIWLVPSDGRDVRNGMDVHFAALGDGRRRFLAPPTGVAFEAAANGGVLTWDGVEGATRYEVAIDGEPKPHIVQGTKLELAALPRDRFFSATIATRRDEDTSDAVPLSFHTFGQGHRLGRVTIDCTGRSGVNLTAGVAVAAGGDGLELQVVNSAGGAGSLAFASPFGIGPAGGTFGTLPAGRPTQERFDSDARNPGSDVFVVGTSDGGVASVRIVERDYPDTVLEYFVRVGAARKRD